MNELKIIQLINGNRLVDARLQIVQAWLDLRAKIPDASKVAFGDRYFENLAGKPGKAQLLQAVALLAKLAQSGSTRDDLTDVVADPAPTIEALTTGATRSRALRGLKQAGNPLLAAVMGLLVGGGATYFWCRRRGT